MRLYLLLGRRVSECAMFYEFPLEFRFVLVYYRNTNSNRLFYLRVLFIITVQVSVILAWLHAHLLFFVQECCIVCIWCKIYITVGTFMVKLRIVIIVKVISFILILYVGSNLEDYLRWQLRLKLELGGTLSVIGCF